MSDIRKRSKSVSGKSGAFFYFTKDNNFILKSISKDELEVLKSMIKDYTQRLFSTVPSYLAKIFGVFKISIGSSSPVLLILMENLSKRFENPLIFDLKGSTHDRFSSLQVHNNMKSMPRDRIYKDVDFANTVKHLDLLENTGQSIMHSLTLDSELLENYEIMDFSMLLLIEEVQNKKESFAQSSRYFRFNEFVSCIGIIDYLQCYTAKKRLENKLNAMKPNETNIYSCIPPASYRARFLKMAANIFSNN